jgi:hypothetical protein
MRFPITVTVQLKIVSPQAILLNSMYLFWM